MMRSGKRCSSRPILREIKQRMSAARCVARGRRKIDIQISSHHA